LNAHTTTVRTHQKTVGLLKQRSSRVCEANVDFVGSESDDLLAAKRSMHLEGKMNGNARERKIATYAAVGAEIQNMHSQWWVQALWRLA